MDLDTHKAAGSVLGAMMILSRKVTKWLRNILSAVSRLSYKGTALEDKESNQEAVVVPVRDDGTFH